MLSRGVAGGRGCSSSSKLRGVQGEGTQGIGEGWLRSSRSGAVLLGSGLKLASSSLLSSAARCEKKSTKLESCQGELLCSG